MKKLLLSTIVSGLLASSAMATVDYNFNIKAGAKNINFDGANSTTLSVVKVSMEMDNSKFTNIYMSIDFGYEMGEIDGANLNAANFQYDLGYKVNKKFIPYGIFGLTSKNDIYNSGTMYYGIGLKYNITNSFGAEVEYTFGTSANGTEGEPDNSNIAAFLSYRFSTVTK